METIQIILIIIGVILFIPAIYISVANNNVTHQPYPIYVSAIALVIIGSVNPSSLINFKAGKDGVEFNRKYTPEQNKTLTDAFAETDSIKNNLSDLTKEQLKKLAKEAQKAEKKIAEDYITLALNEYSNKNYEKTLEYSYQGLSLDIKDSKIKAKLTSLIGNSFYKLNNFELAVKKYKEATKLDPENAYYYFSQGFSYRKLGEIQNALKYYKIAINLDPKNGKFYNNIGYIYRLLKNYDEAIKNYEISIKLGSQENPDDPAERKFNIGLTYNNLGYLYYTLGNNEKALPLIEKAIEIDPKGYRSYDSLGRVYFDRGQKEEALLQYNKALEINPKYSDAYNSLGLLYFDAGNFKEAEKSYKKAIEYDPLHKESFQNLSYLYKNKFK